MTQYIEFMSLKSNPGPPKYEAEDTAVLVICPHCCRNTDRLSRKQLM
jgi:hypothetical protein